MKNFMLTIKDKEQLKDLGIREEDILWQIEMFDRGTPYVELIRPCTLGDGITEFPYEKAKEWVKWYETHSNHIKKIKFVPASGAATRMFKALIRFYNNSDNVSIIENLAKKDDQDAKDFIFFVDNIEKFAFFDDLKIILKKHGYEVRDLIKKKEFKVILKYLLTKDGLNYSNMPKALIKFHRYIDRNRTAFEEHLVEATGYTKYKGLCKLHFTVSSEHKKKFLQFFDQIKENYEKKYNINYQVDFSLQKRCTDTIAVDINNKPFRLSDGSLLFRPGGHGALIYNLNNIEDELIFIKNIDNVVPDRLKEKIYFWTKALAGYLLWLKDKINSFIQSLRYSNINKEIMIEISKFCKKYLYIDIPEDLDLIRKKEYIMTILDRPIRVCGMVPNIREPGGGPFWVKDAQGNISMQIVENAQVDMSSQEQRKIFNSSTHFNPVHIVCWTRDWQGKKFDLIHYVDKNAVFITLKSKDGKDIKALELPGLWNGGMAYWNSIFVEVPAITFNPVKKVTDLLKENHQ